MIDAVLFDLGDTLFRLKHFDTDSIQSRFAECLADRCGIEAEAATAATQRLYSQLQELMVASYGEGLTLELNVAASSLAHLAEYGEHAEWLADELDRIFGETDTSRWEAVPGRAEFLEELRSRGLKIGFVSNTMTRPALMDAQLQQFGLLPLAEVAVYSIAVGHRKPDPKIYEPALSALGVAPERTVFVGDRVREDVRGPQRLGMSAVLTHEFRQEDPADSAPLAVVSDLTELLGVIDNQLR